MRPAADDERRAFIDKHGSSRARTPTIEIGVDEEVAYTRRARKSRLQRIKVWLSSHLRFRRRSLRRHPIQFFCFCLQFVVALLAVLLVVTPLLSPSYLRPPEHYRELKSRCEGSGADMGCANPFNEKVYISVSLYDKGGHLAGGPWGKAVLRLIDMIGVDNVFLSIYENDSGPEGIAALNDFKTEVRCAHEIVSDEHVPSEGFPTITMPDGTKRVKRLAYLSEMRNRALRPLDTFGKKGIVKFDKILFLNDVAFRPVDAAQLLFNTNIGPDGRTQYLTTCALDWRNPFLFYDLYAQRDAEGYANGLPIFPIFSTAGQGLSRADMLAQKDAVPVRSCWGGMVAMQAAYVQNLAAALPRPDFQKIGSHVVDPDEPRAAAAPVRFRSEPEVFFDACECCLFLADVSEVARRSGAAELGVYVNPYVRVAYEWGTLGWLPFVQRWERLLAVPQAIVSPLLRLPTANPHRAVEEGEEFEEEVWDSGAGRWKMVKRKGRSGMFCGVREMQLIQEKERQGDKNWENNEMPPGQKLYFPT